MNNPTQIFIGQLEMKKHLAALCAGSLVVGLSACGEIQDSSNVSVSSMQVGGKNIAGVGDAVLTVENSESLPNAFGGADIFGRTKPTGTTTVYYAGFSGGKANFVRRDVAINSSKTTMNSSPVVVNPSSQTSYSGNFGGLRYSGSSSTNAYPIFLPPNTPRDRVAGVRDVNIAAAIGEPIFVSGRTFTVIEAKPNSVTYSLK